MQIIVCAQQSQLLDRSPSVIVLLANIGRMLRVLIFAGCIAMMVTPYESAHSNPLVRAMKSADPMSKVDLGGQIKVVALLSVAGDPMSRCGATRTLAGQSIVKHFHETHPAKLRDAIFKLAELARRAISDSGGQSGLRLAFSWICGRARKRFDNQHWRGLIQWD